MGSIAVERRYFRCPDCGQGEFGADRVLGLDGYLTDGARRMATLATSALVALRLRRPASRASDHPNPK